MKKNPDAISSEFEDLDVNKVETALKSVGVQLRDATGQIRNFDDIIVDLGNKWDGLSRNAQRYVATIAAGSRQQSRLIALLDDFDRTIELMDIAADSEGKADEQFAKYADTMEYRLNQLATEWEKFKTSIIQEDLFKNSIDGLTDFIERLNDLNGSGVIKLAETFSSFAIMAISIVKSVDALKTSWSTISANTTTMMPIIQAGLANDAKAGTMTGLNKVFGYKEIGEAQYSDQSEKIALSATKQAKAQERIEKSLEKAKQLTAQRQQQSQDIANIEKNIVKITEQQSQALEKVSKARKYDVQATKDALKYVKAAQSEIKKSGFYDSYDTNKILGKYSEDLKAYIPSAAKNLNKTVYSTANPEIGAAALGLYEEDLNNVIKYNEEINIQTENLEKLKVQQDNTTASLNKVNEQMTFAGTALNHATKEMKDLSAAQEKYTVEQATMVAQQEKNAQALKRTEIATGALIKGVNLASTATQSFVGYASMAAMGLMDWSTAAKMGGAQFLALEASQIAATASTKMLAAAQFAQTAQTVLATAAEKGLNAEEIKQLALEKGLSAAQAEHVVTTSAEIAANEGATASFIGLAAAEYAAFAPILIGVAAIAALGIAIFGISKAVEYYKKQHDEMRQATLKLVDAQEQLKQVSENAQQARSEAQAASKQLKDAEELKEKYLELKDIRDKTIEQEDEYKEIQEEIKNTLPEIVLHYDEITGRLEVQLDLWEQILEKQKEAAGEDNKKAFVASMREVYAEEAVNEAQKEYDLALLGKYTADYIKNVNFDTRGELLWRDRSGYIKGTTFSFYEEEIEKGNLEKAQQYQEHLRELIENFFPDEDFINNWKKTTGKDLLDTSKDGIEYLFNFLSHNMTEELEADFAKYDKAYKDEVNRINKKYEESNNLAAAKFRSYTQNFLTQEGVSNELASIIALGAKQTDLSERNLSIFGGQLTTAGWQQSWKSMGSKAQATFQTFGIAQEEFDALSASEAAQLLQAVLAYEDTKNLIIEYEGAFTKSQLELVKNLQDGTADLSISEIRISEIGSGKVQVGEIQSQYNQVLESFADNIRKNYSDLLNYYDLNLNNIKPSDLANLSSATNTFKEKISDKISSNDLNTFLNSIWNISGSDTTSAATILNSINTLSDKWNPFDTSNFEKNMKEALSKLPDIADDAYNQILEAGRGVNLFNLDPSLDQIEQYATKAQEVLGIFSDKGGDIQKYLNKNLGEVVVDAKEAKKLREVQNELLKAGIEDAKEILRIDEDTNDTILDTNKLREIQNRYGDEAVVRLKAELDVEQKKVDKLTEQRNKQGELSKEDQEQLDKSVAEVATLQNLVDLLIDAEKYSKSITNNFDTATGRLSAMSSLVGSVSGALSNFQKNKFLGQSDIASLQETFGAFGINANQFINKNLGLTNPETLYKTAIRELQNSIKSGVFGNDQDKITQAKGTIAELYSVWMEYLEDVEDEQEKIKDKEEDIEEAKKKVLEQEEKVREKEEQNEKDRKKALEDIKKAEEDLVKAKEDYVDQLEVIDEKHKTINDEIEKYNELLYGTKNRKGKLDVFYNYEETISSLSNELSRTTELLGTSEDIDNSVEALQRYTKATSNLIATEKAKQIQIQAGLSNYANMIENGYASYTNKETGQQIGINFGQYAKKDQATGKYILNQRLLNQASFNDEYKNLIEENIETYNKYVDEYEKINDEILKSEKELQDKRKAALKAYSEIEQNVADALKEQYQKEVDELKNKYDSMKAADDDYLSALEDAINKQRELREREDKYEELAEQEKRLSLLQRDTSGTRQIDANKLKKDVEKTRKQLLDDAVNDVVDGLKKLAQENEETRQVELQLRDAIVENTAHWNGEAQAIVPTLNSADEYASYMAGLNPNYSSMTFTQQQVLIEDYKQQFADALEYQAWNLLDTTSASGDAIVDTINVSTDQILAITTEKTTSFSEEVIRSYNEITEKVSEDLENQEKSIQDARDALQDAVDKLEELSKKIDEAAQKIVDLNEEEVKNNEKRIKELEEEKQKVLDYQEEVLKKSKELAKTQAEATGNNLSGLGDVTNIESPGGPQPQVSSNPITLDSKYTGNVSDLTGKTLGEIINYYNEGYKDMKNQQERGDSKSANNSAVAIRNRRQEIAKMLGIPENSSVNDINYALKQNGITRQLSAYAKGGLVNFTGPAWVDGTRTAPEAFLSAADTKAIGAAAQILSDLQLIKDYSSLGQSINNTVGDTSIEINLNIDKLSSEIDIDNMITRVKDEIVAVANPIGINTILKQN